MKVANLNGRLVLLRTGDATTSLDVAEASAGRFSPDPQRVYAQWADFRSWAEVADWTKSTTVDDPDAYGPPVPNPRQVLAVGLNYGKRAAEGGIADLSVPPVFTKFPSSLTGPNATVQLPDGQVDWEAELVVVIAAPAYRIDADQALTHIAGVMVGQDLSERSGQFAGALPQFSLAKSYPGFAPTGPWLATLDELPALTELALTCHVNGTLMQSATVLEMLVSVPELVAALSQRVRLLPGDLIFTGTPGGVGHHQNPPRYLQPGDRLTTEITGMGRQEVRLVSYP